MASVTGADRPRKKIQRKRLPVAPYFLALLAVIGLLWAASVAGAGLKFPTPKLGLDLQGGLSMTLSAYLQDSDQEPDDETMEQARQIIESRVNSTGVSEPEVFVEGTENVVVNVAGSDSDEEALRDVGAPAELRFRIVTERITDTSGLEGLPEPEQDGSEEGAEEEATEGEGGQEPADETSEEPQEDTTDDAAAGGAQVDSTDPEDEQAPQGDVTIEDVWEKVGPEAAEMAQSLNSAPDAASAATLEPFGELTAEEVGVLPANVQFYVPNITCEQLDARPPGSVQDPEVAVAACSSPEEVADGETTGTYSEKFLLQPADVVGSDVAEADVGVDQANLNRFVVNVQFTADGADRWGTLTQENVGQDVAIVLDNEVVSAPTIREASRNSTQISGDFSSEEANQLAEQLNFGSLPINFVVETINEVTATLGVVQLEAGLLAMAIGLLLVFLYCLAYYRVMGFIVLGSLLTATVVLYPTVSLLGSQIGLTLTLAGVAGFVVAIGITADSFVVYFERIKEEMRGGRSARSAVPRAWVRTRRTLLSANAISIIAALVLYMLAIGPVRAFAFALGLSTLVNVMVVFLFTHPIAEWLARGKLLNNVHLSGLHTRTLAVPGKAASRG
ncbi:protein translocase subunit SecD [Glycomyces xiaoerkulensis]|uniref:protein translocase subunit SecD n=1 Tax=Glycomyces xiaoerkulensis TaxID=2038139 RepID=UPI0012FFED72|nr:protein translocase subunit SecD [Glycomyces xiaoerkulensis]